MDLRDFLIDQYRHMEWADASVWRSVLAAERALGDAVVHERLHHIHLVQRAFLGIWRGENVDFKAIQDQDLRGPALAQWARDVYPQAREVLAGTDDETLHGEIVFPWAQQVAEHLGFEPAATTLRDSAAQVYAHTAHHRGQVTVRLRELGETPPLIDFIAWVWRGRPVAEWV